MYLLVNVLEQPEHLVSILEGFANMGIKGSTVMNSTGMGRVLMTAGKAGPAMEEINRIIANGESSNKTIFTVVKEKEMHRILKGSRLEIFDQAGHMPQYECSEEFNNLALEFIQQ
jgi:hypothetical protein